MSATERTELDDNQREAALRTIEGSLSCRLAHFCCGAPGPEARCATVDAERRRTEKLESVGHG